MEHKHIHAIRYERKGVGVTLSAFLLEGNQLYSNKLEYTQLYVTHTHILDGGSRDDSHSDIKEKPSDLVGTIRSDMNSKDVIFLPENGYTKEDLADLYLKLVEGNASVTAEPSPEIG